MLGDNWQASFVESAACATPSVYIVLQLVYVVHVLAYACNLQTPYEPCGAMLNDPADPGRWCQRKLDAGLEQVLTCIACLHHLSSDSAHASSDSAVTCSSLEGREACCPRLLLLIASLSAFRSKGGTSCSAESCLQHNQGSQCPTMQPRRREVCALGAGTTCCSRQLIDIAKQVFTALMCMCCADTGREAE